MKKIYIPDLDEFINWNKPLTAYDSQILALLNSIDLKEILEVKQNLIFTVKEYKYLLFEVILTDEEFEKYERMNIHKKQRFLKERLN